MKKLLRRISEYLHRPRLMDTTGLSPLTIVIVDEKGEYVPDVLGIPEERRIQIENMVYESNMRFHGKSMAEAAASWTGLVHANEVFLATHILMRMNQPSVFPGFMMRAP